MKTDSLQGNGVVKDVSMRSVKTGKITTRKENEMKKIDTKIYRLLLDKLDIIADWCFECEKDGIGNAIKEVICQFDECMEQV